MSGNSKKSKADLDSLYKLEFYRKQSIWKLSRKNKKESSDKAQKSRKSADSKNKCLNITYNVQSAEENWSILNEGFVETDKDVIADLKDIQITDIIQNLPQDWSEPVRHDDFLCQEHKPKDIPTEGHDVPDNILQNEPSQCYPHRQEKQYENVPKYKEKQYIWQHCQPENLSAIDIDDKYKDEECKIEEKQYDWQQWQPEELPEIDKRGCEGPEAGWPLETQIWVNHKMLPEEIWSQDVLRELELLNVHEVEPDTPPAEKWVPPNRILHWMLANKECIEDVLESSCETEEQFMLSAHRAPHSSEIDIQEQTQALEESMVNTELVSSEPVGLLSEAALMAARMAHMRALRKVVAELRVRESGKRLRSTSQPALSPHDISCEEFPTRDIGMYQPTFIDTFISGSYKNNPNDKHLDISKSDPDCVDDGGEIYQKHTNINSLGSQEQTGLNQGQLRKEWTYKCKDGSVMRLENGQIVIDKSQMRLGQGETGVQDKMGLNRAEMRLDMGEMGLNKAEMRPDMGEMELNWGELGLDRDEMGTSKNQSGGFGDYNTIGRGRGRLPIQDLQIGVGRGRGRI